MAKETSSCRLPDTVVPIKYSLRYDDLCLDSCKFSGSVVIDCQVQLRERRDAALSWIAASFAEILSSLLDVMHPRIFLLCSSKALICPAFGNAPLNRNTRRRPSASGTRRALEERALTWSLDFDSSAAYSRSWQKMYFLPLVSATGLASIMSRVSRAAVRRRWWCLAVEQRLYC